MNYSQLLSECWTYGSSYFPMCPLPSWATAFLPSLGGYQALSVGHRRFRVLQKLGEGGYAVVFLVSELPTPEHPHPDPEPRALKKVLVQSGEHFDAVQQEMLIHSSVHHHPNILPLLDYSCSEGDLAYSAVAATSPPRNLNPTAGAGGESGCGRAGHAHRSLNMGGFGTAAAGPTLGIGRLGGPVGRTAGAAVAPSGGGLWGGGGGVERVACFLFPAFRDGTLASELERLAAQRAQLPTAEVLAVFLQMAKAAAHVHAHGYAHRDIKPLNVLIAINPEYAAAALRQAQPPPQLQGRAGPGRPSPHAAVSPAGAVSTIREEEDVEAGVALRGYRCVLMDFGSARSRQVAVSNRTEALALQEDAEAHCSAPYRAPEFFDVPSPATLDLGAADVWALGASLFHVMYGEPPFQRAMNAAGGSLALAVINCAIGWPRPGSPAYPRELHQLVMAAMAQEPADRPTAAQLVEMVQALQLQHLPDPALTS